MIKVTVAYPNTQGSQFDINYYCKTHIPLVQRLVGAAPKGVAVEQGIAGGTQARRLRIWRSGNSGSIPWKRFRRVLARTHRRSWPISQITRMRSPSFRSAK